MRNSATLSRAAEGSATVNAMLTRPVQPLPPGAALARYAKALRWGADFAAQEFPDSPQVGAALELRQRAAVSAVSTGSAPDLISVGIWDPQTALLLQAVDAFEAARGKMREIPFTTATPREIGTGTVGNWVDETTAKMVLSYAFDSLTLGPSLIGGIVVLSDELLRDRRSDPLIRSLILGTLGRTTTQLFLDLTATSTTAHPGSITSTGTAITATGDVAADLASMLAAITTTGAGLAWMVAPADLAYIAAHINAPDVPKTLLGLPVILAPNAPSHQVTLADLSEIAYAAAPLAIELSRQGTVEMDDAPTMSTGGNGSPAGATGTVVVSMFQTNCVAFKLTRFVNWSVVRDGAVSYCVMNAGSPA